MSVDPKTQQIIDGAELALSAILTAASPLMGPLAPAVAALAPEIPALAHAIQSAIDGGADPTAAAKAALAQTTALDPGPVGARLDAVDQAALARIHAHLQQTAPELAPALLPLLHTPTIATTIAPAS